MLELIADKVKNCNSIHKLYEACEELQFNLGYHNFFVLTFVDDEKFNNGRSILYLSNWPEYLLRATETDMVSAIRKFALTTPNPSKIQLGSFDFQDLINMRELEDPTVIDILKDRNLDIGLGIHLPNYSNASGSAFFLFGGDYGRLESHELVSDICRSVILKYEHLHELYVESTNKLSKRERECLQWTSEGKTSYEIGIILGLSENTINNYIATVGRKLGAVNRAHMVSIGFRSGYIT
ncbi:MAG: helix-turn-helix transcriptional regulator [Pseudomonadota bacterium]